MADHTTDFFSSRVRPDSDVNPIPAAAYPPAEFQRILSMTEQLFPGPIDVRQETDPEISDHHYFAFRVVAKGDFDDIMARDRQ